MLKSCILFIFVINVTPTISQQSGCQSSKLQSGEKGSFSSINYPLNYSSSSICEWLISVPSLKIIKLTFNKNFELEKGRNTGNCHDSVQVYDGSILNIEQVIGEYCGNVAPNQILVNNNQAVVKFNSDSSRQFKGFSVQWEAVNKVTNDSKDNQQSGCKSPRLQSGEQGNFSSINYPRDYTSFLKCEWLIKVPATKIIKLTFNVNFETDKGSVSGNCYDSVKIFEVSNSSNGKIGEYCGRVAPGPIFVNSSQAFVTFNSDRSQQFKGFSVQWEAVGKVANDSTDDQQSGCNSPKLQSGERGIISSMNYPSKYAPKANCEWLITVAATKKIKLTFNDTFNLEKYGLRKCYDSVEVFKVTRERIGQYCGKTVPNPIVLNESYAVVRFRSDPSNQKEGFSIEWSAVDKESLVEQQSGCKSPRLQSGEQGNFSSINYPNNYTSFLNCEWLITVPATKIIKLTFNNIFETEKTRSGYCFDSVKVFAGSNSSNGLIGEYCGRVAPDPIFVNISQVFVTFNSDSSNHFKGFSVQWEAVESVANNSTARQ